VAISEHATGTRTAGTPPEASFTALGTSPDTTDGVFQFFIDCVNLANGDTIEIQLLEKVTSGGTARIVYESTVSNVQDEPIWVSPALTLMHGWTLQMRQTLGTARTYDWSQRKIA
jgi:hypothetical protein